jgi:diguanylate cyclase (GGDEF)-like protein
MDHVEREEFLTRIAELEEKTKELDQKSYNLFILYHASKALGSILDEEELLQLSVDMTTEVMGCEWGAIYLVNEETGLLELRKVKGLDSRPFPPSILKLGEGFPLWLNEKSEILSFRILMQGTPFFNAFPEVQLLEPHKPSLVVSLFHKVRFLGLLILGNRLDGQPFSANDFELLSTITSLSATSLMNAHLYELAIRDGTTKLFVARYFRRRLQEEVKRSKRYSKPLAFVMMDIDDFKKVNDAYGHLEGDRTLAQISAIIRSCSREDVDIPCRYGGEEFALLLPETDLSGAYLVAERIRAKVEATKFSLAEAHVTISAGVAIYPDDADEDDALVEKADFALYDSKKSGKNKVSAHNKSFMKDLKK